MRPTTYAGIKKADTEKLEAIAAELGKKCEVVADFSSSRDGPAPVKCEPKPNSCGIKSKAEDVLSMLKRRPCSLDDICSGLGVGHDEAQEYISGLQGRGVINSEEKDGRIFFKASS